MIRSFVFCLFSLLTLPVWAGVEEVVQVESAPCGDANGLRGSGLLLSVGNAVWVLTSDHVLFHGNDSYCHQVRSPTVGTLPARYLTSEWGLGLALLELSQTPVGGPWKGPDDLGIASVAQGDAVQVVGFPSLSTTPLEDDRGVVEDPQFPSPLFALQEFLIEVRGAHGEFGMSGGPLFDSHGAFVGVLSHQRQAPDNRLLVVPGARVAAWVAEVIRGGAAYRPQYYQSPMAQSLPNKEHVWAGNHLFHFTEASPDGGSVLFDYLPDPHSRPHPDPLGRLRKVEAYADPQHVMPLVEVGFYEGGNPKRLAVTSLSRWLGLLDRPGLTVRVARRLFHEDRWDPLNRIWTQVFDDLLRLKGPLPTSVEPLVTEIRRLGDRFRAIPEKPGGTGPVQVQPVLYHLDWLWARDRELVEVLRRSDWSEFRQFDGKVARTVERALEEARAALDLKTL